MEDLSLHILDIVENSVAAGASLVTVVVIEDMQADRLSLEIQDNGKGMSGDQVRQLLDPFFTSRTTRRVGMGLSLLAQSAREADGDVIVTSRPNNGTNVRAFFRHSHIDRKPLGNLPDTFSVLVTGNPDMDFVFTYQMNSHVFSFDTRQLRIDLEGVPLNAPEVIIALRTFFRDSFSEIK